MLNSIITSHINQRVHKIIRWCTPSIDPTSERIKDPYQKDISVSYQSLGYPSEPSGIFGKAHEMAASVYGADQTLFSVNGSTGSNFIVFRTLMKQFGGDLKILAQRNIHRSVLSACEDYHINLVCLPPEIDQKLQIFLPNKIDDFIYYISKEKPQVLLITNPTYEGFVLDLKKLVQTVRSHFPDLIIFIEEAWGSHLSFSKKLPISAMQADADICVQSTHKQGGALQQAGMIHWKRRRIDSDLLLDSYRKLSTSSPSYILLASLDAARAMMEKKGVEKIDYLIHVADTLRSGIAMIPELRLIDTKTLNKAHPSVFDMDSTKVLVDVSETGFSGFDLAEILEQEYSIIVEKYNERTLLFLTPLQATVKDAEITAKIFRTVVSTYKRKKYRENNNIIIPKNGKKMLVFDSYRDLNMFERVSLKKACGRIAAEDIVPYPPGIPLTIRGEELTSDVVNFYFGIKRYSNSHFFARDPFLNTVIVIKE